MMRLLLLLCLGLNLICAHEEESNDVVRSNFDASKVASVEHSDFGLWGVVWRILNQGVFTGGQEFFWYSRQRGVVVSDLELKASVPCE